MVPGSFCWGAILRQSQFKEAESHLPPQIHAVKDGSFLQEGKPDAPVCQGQLRGSPGRTRPARTAGQVFSGRSPWMLAILGGGIPLCAMGTWPKMTTLFQRKKKLCASVSQGDTRHSGRLSCEILPMRRTPARPVNFCSFSLGAVSGCLQF